MTRSVKRIASRERRADEALRKKAGSKSGNSTVDSYQNFAAKLGIGTDNVSSGGSYGFNPITRNRVLLEWIHRGTWLGGVAVDLVADDMTRAGIEFQSDLDPKQLTQLAEAAVSLSIWKRINETIKWARLYGGCIAVMLIDGQDPRTELRMQTIGRNQFKGLLVLDRWMVEPSLEKLVTKFGPDLGLPMYYEVTADAPALPRMTIHHSRCIRLIGIEVPYWQRVAENLWGISVIERIYDRMLAFDSATTGAAQLVFKSFLRTLKIPNLRQIIAAGNKPLEGLVAGVNFMSRFQGIEGITLIDGEDDLTMDSTGRFAGLSDALMAFGQQLSGATQIPLVRLFGQSPAGLNSSGESDLRTYYDNINKDQEKDLRIPVTRVYEVLSRSEGIPLPQGSKLAFRSLWQLSDTEKSGIAETTTRAVTQAEDAGIINQKTAMQELKQSAHVTGIYSNITDADIEAASDEVPPRGEEAMRLQYELMGGGDDKSKGGDNGQKKPAKDSAFSVSELKRLHDIDVVIENQKGSIRTGGVNGSRWSATLADDYGYIRRTIGDDLEQVDCFVGHDPSSQSVWVIQQVDAKTKAPDEAKVLLGYTEVTEALRAYLDSYSDNAWERIGGVAHMFMPQFKRWLSTKEGAPL